EKAQKEMYTDGKEREKRRTIAEREKNQKVAEFMQNFKQFFAAGKYKEAEMWAMKAKELDPDNVAADAAVHIAKMQDRHINYKNLHDRREEGYLKRMNQAEDTGPPEIGDDMPLVIDAAIAKRNIRERKDYGPGISFPTRNAAERRIEQRLSEPININFKD